MVSGLEECCDYAGQHGVFLALENHGGPTATAEGLLAFVKDVKSPWFAVNLDSGNFNTEDIYGDLAKIAPYAVNAQVKVAVRGADKQKRPSDFALLAKILRDAGYRGYVVLEFEEPGDPRVECPKFIDQIRAAFA
jgi:sugar phosphate isomerase/epimerase